MPRSFLKPSGNLLILLEEENGNPLGISLDRVLRTSACGQVSESHLPPASSWLVEKQRGGKNSLHHILKTVPSIELSCGPGRSISKILFASYGTPSGNCLSYAQGNCHASNSKTIVEQVRITLSLFTNWNLINIQYAMIFMIVNISKIKVSDIEDESLTMSCYLIHILK